MMMKHLNVKTYAKSLVIRKGTNLFSQHCNWFNVYNVAANFFVLSGTTLSSLLSGASEPVAKAYAEELARHAISIIFVTRDPSSVRDMSAYLSQNYGVETLVVSADFSLDQVACKPIKEALRGKDIGFLVNCVDESLASPQSLIEVPEQHLLDLVNRNIAVTTLMTRLVLPGMVDRSRGAVVNISSGACCRPLLGRVTLTASTVRQITVTVCRHGDVPVKHIYSLYRSFVI